MARSVVALLCLFAGSILQAQSYLQDAGHPSFATTIAVPNGYIDISNGNLHMEISVSSVPQRGNLHLNERLVYDSRIWQPVSSGGSFWSPTNVPNSMAGWRFIRGNETGTIGTSFTSQYTTCWNGTYNQPFYIYTTFYTWTDPSGTVHPFSAYSSTQTIPSSCTSQTPGTYTNVYSGWATDSSGYYASLTQGSNGSVNIAIKDNTGTQVYPQVTDRFGNYWSSSNGDLVDDRGQVPVISSSNGTTYFYDALAPNGPINNNGTRVRYTVTTEQLSVSTGFGQTGVSETSSSLQAIQSIALPDGSSYGFTYDSYGELQSVTLPTGGVVNYGWSNVTDAFGQVNRWVSSSQVDGYTTSYNLGVVSSCSSMSSINCQQNITVHRPSGDETVHTMTLNNGAWDSMVTVYQGSAASGQAKVTRVMTYDFSQPCSIPGCSGAQNVTVQKQVTNLPDVSLTSSTQTTYNPLLGQLLDVKQWDYSAYSATPSALPTRETKYTYTNYDLASTTIFDQTGAIAASTTYNYTTSAAAAPALAGNGSANSGGPYLASVVLGDNAPTASFTTSYQYDTAGTLLATSDADGNPPTTYKYDPTDTFVIEVDRPTTNNSSGTFQHISRATYDSGTGALLTTDDENSVAHGGAYTVKYTYENVAGRPHSIMFPDGGSTTYSYPGPNEVDTSIAQSSSTTISTAEVVDGYGRASTASSQGISTITKYDMNGRVLSTSTPSTSTASPTDGTTQVQYDTLNRPLTITNPDGSVQRFTYTGNATIATDEVGNQTKQVYDGFGQLASVIESDPNSGALVMETDYKRDALGNVICVEQHGNVSGTGCSSPPSSDGSSPWRVRRFYYDQASRLRAAEIPEHTGQWSVGGTNYFPPSQNCQTPDNASQWTDCYFYDPNGNLSTSVDNRGVSLTYGYDFLNRPISESNASIQLLYSYDSGNNGLGYMASHSSGSNAVSLFGYDVMGRLTQESACRNGGCPNNYGTTSAQYDLAGNAVTLTYPDGRVMRTGLDSLNRPSALVYQQWGAQQIGTSYWSNPTFAPPGQLLSAQYGLSGQTPALQVQASYNNRQSLTSLTYSSPTGSVLGKRYQWDRNAVNLLQETNQLNSTTRVFGYDRINRLVSAQDTTGIGTYSTGSVLIGGTEGHTLNCITIGRQRSCTTVYDTGTLTITVGSFVASVTYGSGSTATTLANSLLNLLNTSASPVVATLSGLTLNLTSKATGSSADYALTGSASDFTATPSGPTMTGGQSASPLPGGLNQAYTLDQWGNLSSMGNTGFTQIINNQNQINAYLYDAAGRVVTDPTTGLSYTYDDNNMMTWGSDGTSYTYDAQGRRTAIASRASLTYYYYFGNQLLSVQDGRTGAWTDLLYVGLQKIGYVSGTQSATPTFTATDHVASEVATVDSSGNVLSSLDYTPHGQVLSGQSSTGFIFTGLQRDHSGLDHALARQYSSMTGRWTTPDPSFGSYHLSDPQSLNRYSYVRNRPLAATDTTGLDDSYCDGSDTTCEDPNGPTGSGDSGSGTGADGTGLRSGPPQTTNPPCSGPNCFITYTGTISDPPTPQPVPVTFNFDLFALPIWGASNGSGGGGTPNNLIQLGKSLFSNNCNKKFGQVVPGYSKNSFFNQLANAPIQQYPGGTPNIPSHDIGADADTQLGQPGRPIRLFPNFYGNSQTYQAFVLIHEGTHRFTGWTDSQFLTHFGPVGLQPPGGGYGTGNFTSWLQGGCKP